MTVDNSTTNSCLVDFWQSLSSVSETGGAASAAVTESCTSSLSSTARSVNWMVENRGGLAKISGLVMVPSQLMGPNAKESKAIIDRVCAARVGPNNITAKTYTVTSKEEDFSLQVVICYPPGMSSIDHSDRCVVYHNPNGVTIAQYFQQGRLSWTPGEIMNITKCPIILYDYRGTGLNQDSGVSSSLMFRPTYETIVADGVAVTDFAFEMYFNIDVWGSSLGGGVATESLRRCLIKHHQPESYISLTNHDSFTTTPRVVMPSYPWLADNAGSLVGANLNAELAMKSIIEQGYKVTVLCHRQDPVIPAGARMAEYVEQFKDRRNVTIISSDSYGHANLSHDMIARLAIHKKTVGTL